MPAKPRPARLCTAPRCAVEIQRGKLMCRPHWFELPRLIRQEINAAWKEGRIRDWSSLCLQARSFLTGTSTGAEQ